MLLGCRGHCHQNSIPGNVIPMENPGNYRLVSVNLLKGDEAAKPSRDVEDKKFIRSGHACQI